MDRLATCHQEDNPILLAAASFRNQWINPPSKKTLICSRRAAAQFGQVIHHPLYSGLKHLYDSDAARWNGCNSGFCCPLFTWCPLHIWEGLTAKIVILTKTILCLTEKGLAAKTFTQARFIGDFLGILNFLHDMSCSAPARALCHFEYRNFICTEALFSIWSDRTLLNLQILWRSFKSRVAYCFIGWTTEHWPALLISVAFSRWFHSSYMWWARIMHFCVVLLLAVADLLCFWCLVVCIHALQC